MRVQYKLFCIYTPGQQGKTESNFTLHGIPKRDEDYFTINDTNLQKGELLTYALPADNNYSLFFEVFTTFGSMNLSLDFSEGICIHKRTSVITFNILSIQQHMMSKVCQWRRKEMGEEY